MPPMLAALGASTVVPTPAVIEPLLKLVSLGRLTNVFEPAWTPPPVDVTRFGKLSVPPLAGLKYVFCAVVNCGKLIAEESLLIVT